MSKTQAEIEYGDIIGLSRPHSTRRQMSKEDRAAQFSPFAALTGFDDAIDEEGRLTDAQEILEEERLEKLNETFAIIVDNLEKGEHPLVSFRYFVPDEKKSGGRYITVSGKVAKIDAYNRVLSFEDRQTFYIDRISSITVNDYIDKRCNK